ncbi:MAG: hypothetical protein US53_C0014G0011, partial [Candidatus Woesebacteria bacterium GW2011_GWA1_37_7]
NVDMDSTCNWKPLFGKMHKKIMDVANEQLSSYNRFIYLIPIHCEGQDARGSMGRTKGISKSVIALWGIEDYVFIHVDRNYSPLSKF